MKILHTSDLHLNSKMNSKLDAARAKERKRELILNFRSMTEFAEAQGCEVFIIAGDLFDTETSSYSVKKSTLDIISAAKDIMFLYLPGNHEKDSLSNYANLPDNLLFFGEEWTYFDIGGVRFAGRTKTKHAMFDELEAPESGALVAVLHGELKEYSDSLGGIGKRELRQSCIDYLALGHYHFFSEYEFSKGKYAVYSGTPAGRGFDEEGEKGFVLIDINAKNVNYTFQKSNVRRLIIRDVDIENCQGIVQIEEKITKACQDVPKEDFLRVRLVGYKSPEARIDTHTLSERFANKYYYFEVKDESRVKISPEEYMYDKSLKGEFIRLVTADAKLSDEEKEQIISSGIRALMGERFDD